MSNHYINDKSHLCRLFILAAIRFYAQRSNVAGTSPRKVKLLIEDFERYLTYAVNHRDRNDTRMLTVLNHIHAYLKAMGMPNDNWYKCSTINVDISNLSTLIELKQLLKVKIDLPLYLAKYGDVTAALEIAGNVTDVKRIAKASRFPSSLNGCISRTSISIEMLEQSKNNAIIERYAQATTDLVHSLKTLQTAIANKDNEHLAEVINDLTNARNEVIQVERLFSFTVMSNSSNQ